jgi:TetR/AcrR family transcriptional repressor of bet genes
MDKTVKAKRQEPRKASRDTRRQQLIDSTIATIGRRGYAKTTLTEVARNAGLSHGLINFHFKTKEQLLNDTLSFLMHEYRENWTRALQAAGERPADQLAALLRADFNEAVCTEEKQTAWVAFWGEAQSRPVYQDMCGPMDREYAEKLEDICTRLVAEGGYRLEAEHAARVLRVMLEGMWMELVRMEERYSLDAARKTAFTAAAALFPKHFTPDGPLG